MTAYELLPTNTMLDVPVDVAVCPYCGAALYIQFEQWGQQEDGSWVAENVHGSCVTEPDILSDEWQQWFNCHCIMPYVYQLPVDQRIEKWVSEHSRFDIR